MLQRGWRIEYSAASDSFTGDPNIILTNYILIYYCSLPGYLRRFLHSEKTLDALDNPQYSGSSGELENSD